MERICYGLIILLHQGGLSYNALIYINLFNITNRFMKVYFLITGLLRTFIKTLYPFLSILEKYIECEFIICTSRDDTDTNYTGISINDQLDKIMKNTKYNFILESENINFPNNLSQREKNTIYQWFHLEKAFNYMNDKVIDDNNIIIIVGETGSGM
jgi:hypothetical protein